MIVGADVGASYDLMWHDTVVRGCVVCVACAGRTRRRAATSRSRSCRRTRTTVSAVVVMLDAHCRGVDVLCVSVCFAEGDWGIEISYNFTHRAVNAWMMQLSHFHMTQCDSCGVTMVCWQHRVTWHHCRS